MHSIMGGTFDIIHDGHMAMLKTAFQDSDLVTIGLTTDDRASDPRERDITPIKERFSNLKDICLTYSNIFNCDFEIKKIDNSYGGAVDTNADAIVISPEEKTLDRAREINKKRTNNDLDRLQIIQAPMIRDYKGRKISSTNIHNNEIDKHGRKVE